MAFLVGNLIFSPLADSFASVNFADNYHEKRGNILWAAIDDDTKEQLLIKASDYVKDVSYGKWKDSFALYSPVPTAIAQGVSELALIANTTSLLPNPKRLKKSVKIGPISVEYDDSGPSATQFVAAFLKFVPYLKAGAFNAGQARLIRA